MKENEMEGREPRACAHLGKVYPHGADECIKGKCMICADGEWRERVDVCPPSGGLAL